MRNVTRSFIMIPYLQENTNEENKIKLRYLTLASGFKHNIHCYNVDKLT